MSHCALLLPQLKGLVEKQGKGSILCGKSSKIGYVWAHPSSATEEHSR